MDPGSPTDQYWCAQDEDAFARSYFAKASSQGGISGYGSLTTLQRIAYLHYYGALPVGYVGDRPTSAAATRSGEQGENVEVRVNQFHIHVNAKHQIIVAPKLAWGCQATNTNAQSMADASRGSSILEYLWKSGPYEQMAIGADLGAGLAGEEFLFTYWNKQGGKATRRVDANGQTIPQGAMGPDGQLAPGVIEYEGDVDCYAVPAWDVLRQNNAKTFEASPWRSARVPRNRWDLIAQYPDKRDEILKIPAAVNNDGNYQSSLGPANDPDTVICHYFFHRRMPALPLGLQAVLLSADCVLEFEALEPCYEHSPIHRFRAKDLKGTPYAYTSSWEAMGIQDLITDLQGSLATNIVTFAKQMIIAEAGTDLPPNQLGNGPAIIYKPKGSADPTALALAAAQPEMFKHLERLRDDLRSTFGLNDMAMGQPPQGPPNAQAWALLATANITNNSDEQRNFIEGVRSVGRSLLAIIKAKMDTKRKVSIVGDFGAAVPKQDEFDKSDFAGIDDVSVDIDNPLMQTSAGRLPIAQMYIDQGFVQVPEQLETLVTTGKLEPMTQVLRNELIFIASENEAILAGQTPTAMITDSHQMHIREHKDAMFIPNGRTNPQVISAYNAHQQQHFQLALQSDPRILQLLGQAAPAQPAPLPQGPPGVSKAAKQAGPALQPPGSAAQGEAAKIPVPSAPAGTQPNPAAGVQ